MAKWKVKLIFKEVVIVEDIEADDKEAAIKIAVDTQEEKGYREDYFWHDAEASTE